MNDLRILKLTKHPKDHRKLWLANKINENNFTQGAELGVQQGVTFEHIIEQCPQLTWHGIDTWSGSKGEGFWVPLQSKFKDESRAKFYKMTTNQAVDKFADESLDIVFIDADHSYNGVKTDIINWLPKVKKGGIICGHDINQAEVRKAVEETIISYETGPDLIWWKWKV